MRNEIYEEFIRAKELTKTQKYNEAIILYRKILNKNPNNNICKLELARNLSKNIETLNEARKLLEQLLLIDTHSRNYVLLELLHIEIRLSNYKQAYKYLDMIKDCDKNFIQSIEGKNTKNFLKFKLGKLSNDDINSNSYFLNQLINYNQNCAIEHIENHFDENQYKRLHSLFLPEIRIKNLLKLVKYNISKILPTQTTIVDKYTVDFNLPIGSVCGIETNKIQVVTLMNTTNILTMYPYIYEYTVEENNKILRK